MENKYNKINNVVWAENYKIRIANSRDSFQKHEVIKLIYMMKYLEKHKSERSWIRIYSEWEVMDGVISDLFIQNLKSKECFAVEIQKSINQEWNKKKEEQFKDWEVYGFKTADLVVVPLKEAPKDLDKLNLWLEQFIF